VIAVRPKKVRPPVDGLVPVAERSNATSLELKWCPVRLPAGRRVRSLQST
jgi:hypothetical protein